MPASLPGATLAENQANPTQGRFVTFDPLSGPKGSSLDAMMPTYDGTGGLVADPDNCSTGALSTGIGFGGQIIGLTPDRATAPVALLESGFNDNMIPGEEPTYAAPPPIGVISANAIDSTYMYIGGGRMEENPDATDPDQRGRPFTPDPYTAGVAIVGAGEGIARDGGAGPAYTGLPLNSATASGAVAEGAAIEAGILNVSGQAMVSGQSAFGSVSTPLAAPT